MAKLFMQELPTKDELRNSVTRLDQSADSSALYANLLVLKIANELENYMDSLLAPYNLSAGRVTLLFMLNNAPEGLMPSELSNKVGVTQATISGLLNGLEKAELVKREMHQKDGRSFVIKISEKGEALLKELIPIWSPKISEFWRTISAQELDQIGGALEKLIKSVNILKVS